MRVLNTLLSVLIAAGILSSTVASSQNVFEESVDILFKCVQYLGNTRELAAEIIAARPKGELDTVFKKYCRKLPIFKECVENHIEISTFLQTSAELDGIDVIRNVTNSFLEFICFEDGRRLSLFLDSGGIECHFSSDRKSVFHCAGKKFNSYITAFGGKPTAEDCDAARNLRTCSVQTLEKCVNSSIANVLDAGFQFLFRKSDCGNLIEKHPMLTRETLSDQLETVTTTHIPEEKLPTKKEGFQSFAIRKCEKNGGPNAYETVKEDWNLFADLNEIITNKSQLPAETIAARSNDTVGTIIMKYCRRAPILNACNKYFIDSVKSCLEPEEQKTADIINNMSSSWLNFLCHNGGERVSTLINSGAIHCFASPKLQPLGFCVEQNFGSYLPRIMNLEMPFAITAKVCIDMNQFRDCSINLLNECEDKTPLNLFKSTFEVVYNETSCENLLAPSTTEIPRETPIHSTIASKIVSKSKKQIQKASDLDILLGLISHIYLSNTGDERIEKLLMKMCQKNSGPMAYKTVKAIPRYISNGIRSFRESVQLLDSEIDSAPSVDKVVNILEQFCRGSPNVQQYLKHVTDSIMHCVKPEEREALDLGYNIARSLLEYACQEDGNLLAKFILAAGTDCFISKELVVRDCISNANPSQLPSAIFVDLDHEKWMSLKQAQNCTVEAMKECENREPAQFIDDLMNFVANEIMPYETTTIAETTTVEVATDDYYDY